MKVDYMTVQQVLDELQKIEDKSMPICIDGDTKDFLVTSVIEQKYVVTISTCYQDYHVLFDNDKHLQRRQ